MWPWVHAAFGYALVVLAAVALRRRVSRAELLAVVTATQVPDLVDKPLAWWLGVLPAGRSLAHSVVFALPFVVAVAAVARRRGRPELGPAVALGYASHLVGDTYLAVYYWRPEEFTFLLWPVLPAYPYEPSVGVLVIFRTIAVSPDFGTHLVAAAAVGLVVLAHFLRAPWWWDADAETRG